MQIYNFLKFNICEMSQREEWKFDCVLKLKYHLSIWTGFCHVTDVQQKFNNFSRDRNSFANTVLDIWVDWKYFINWVPWTEVLFYASNIANECNWFLIVRGIVSFFARILFICLEAIYVFVVSYNQVLKWRRNWYYYSPSIAINSTNWMLG